MQTPPIVTQQEWEAAREELLVEEKKLTRARDALAAKRRRMPWMAVEKPYRFEGRTVPRACSISSRAAASSSSTASSTGRRSLPTQRAARTRSAPAWGAPSSPTR